MRGTMGPLVDTASLTVGCDGFATPYSATCLNHPRYIVIACIVMACMVMAYEGMADIVMAYIVMACLLPA